MDPQFQEVAEQITKDVAAAVNEHVTEVIAAAEKRLSEQAQVNVEVVKDHAKLAAEGYAATLEGIERRLDDIHKSFTSKFRDHDRVLSNHSTRITALERKRPARRE